MLRGWRSIATQSKVLIFGRETLGLACLETEAWCPVGIYFRLRVSHDLVLTEVVGSGRRDLGSDIMQVSRIWQDSVTIHFLDN
jgi:hypothetical protein